MRKKFIIVEIILFALIVIFARKYISKKGTDNTTDTILEQTETTLEEVETTTTETTLEEVETTTTETTLEEVETTTTVTAVETVSYDFIIKVACFDEFYELGDEPIKFNYVYESGSNNDSEFYYARMKDGSLKLDIEAPGASKVFFISNLWNTYTTISGDYEGALLKEGTSINDGTGEFTDVAFDYAKLKNVDYEINVTRDCQRGLFIKDQGTIENTIFEYGGYDGPILTAYVEYEDGTIYSKDICIREILLDENGEITTNEENAVWAALGLTCENEELLRVRNDSDDKEIVYLGDTIKFHMDAIHKTILEDPVTDLSEDVELKLEVDGKDLTGIFVYDFLNDEFENYYSEDLCNYGYFIGRKVGDYIELSGDHGDTGWTYKITILEIE